MKVIRYSKYGFKSQKQTYHAEQMENLKELDINSIPKHLRHEVEKIAKRNLDFYEKHKEDLSDGIWVFVDGHKNNQALNHLKEMVPCWEAEIEEDIVVYDVNWEEQLSIKDPLVTAFGCYVPKKEIEKLKNIKKRKRKVV